ncbi:MAG: transposase, partial [Lachnospiraceae bacterium]|nr:transposase [Lachnospiraceae bacterium]
MYQKYVNAMPLYRIEKDFKQYGVNITRATLTNWVIQNTERFLSPLYSYLHRLLLNRIYIMA